jgi:hypothetical protein
VSGRVITDEQRRRGHISRRVDLGRHRRWIRRRLADVRATHHVDDFTTAGAPSLIRAAAAIALENVVRLAALEVVATPFAESIPARRRLAVLREVQEAFQTDDRIDVLADLLFKKEAS